MKQTGGKWNPAEGNIYFIAAYRKCLMHGMKAHPYILSAVNEIKNDEDLEWLVETVKDSQVRVLVDSGVFALANGHAVAHDITMDEALALAPSQIDGFDELYRRYSSIVEAVGNVVWGYIEIDQGGRDNKIKTRAKLEAAGFRPIPVYHPFNDGWDYFDELASNYDRICFGNIVQADSETRKRLLATAWERKRKYPHLWIHLLGLSPNERLNAYPIDSCDSSGWLANCRWRRTLQAVTAGKAFSDADERTGYQLGSDAESDIGSQKAKQMGGYDAEHMQRNWRGLIADYQGALGVDPRTGNAI